MYLRTLVSAGIHYRIERKRTGRAGSDCSGAWEYRNRGRTTAGYDDGRDVLCAGIGLGDRRQRDLRRALGGSRVVCRIRSMPTDQEPCSSG